MKREEVQAQREIEIAVFKERAGTFRLDGYSGLIFRSVSSGSGSSSDGKGTRTYTAVSFIVPGTILCRREDYRDDKGITRMKEYPFCVTRITQKGIFGTAFSSFSSEGIIEDEEIFIPPHILVRCRKERMPAMSPEDKEGIRSFSHSRYLGLVTWARRDLVPLPGKRRCVMEIPDRVRQFFRNNPTASFYYEYVAR